MKNIFLYGLIVVIFIIVPHTSHAYFTTNQTAVKLNDHTALFVIEYAFGLDKEDLYMPAITERGLSWESTTEKVGYVLTEDQDDSRTNGTVTAVVLSHAPIVNGMYKLEKGKAQKMWLIALLTTNEDELETDYALQVQKLPFYVDTGDTKLQTRQLNPSELQYYVTKEVELNTGNFPKK